MNVGKIFGGQAIKRGFQVDSNVGIGVFVDRKGRGRVLEEDMQQPDLDSAQISPAIDDF
jgi:hypothetical protein